MPQSPLGSILGTVLSGRKLGADDLHAVATAAGQVFEGVMGRVFRGPSGAGMRMSVDEVRVHQAQHAYQPPPPPPPPEPPPKFDPRELAAARRQLGFDAGAVLAADMIAARRKKLARKHHPDLPGGSAAKMTAINAAADLLLAELEYARKAS